MSILPLNENEKRINEITDLMFFFTDEDAEQKQAFEVELNGLMEKEGFRLKWMLTVIKEKQAILDARTEVRKKSQKREQSAKNSLEFMRSVAFEKMQSMNIDKVDNDYGSMTVSNGQKQVIYSNSFSVQNLPEGLYRIEPEEYFPEKAAIKKALKNGDAITGCTLVDGEKILTVR